MRNWLRLIRYKNLLIVFLTQLLVWYCLIYDSRNLLGLWRFWDFFPIALSTLLIAAAGYIINDYFDIKIDLINRPDKIILEKRIPLRAAIIAHVILNVIAMVLVIPIAYHARHLEWLLVQMLCIVLLWFYSTHFKRKFIVGNVIIALLTALTILVLVVYEPALRMHYGIYKFPNYQEVIRYGIDPKWMFGAFTFFAFTLTWMREIVKDMEDYKGDASEGCMTMPIKKGLQFSARFAQTLGAITIITLSVISYFFITNKYLVLGIYTIALIVLPLIWWCKYITQKNTIEHYGSASKWLKFIMLSGIASLIVYHFSIQQIQ